MCRDQNCAVPSKWGLTKMLCTVVPLHFVILEWKACHWSSRLWLLFYLYWFWKNLKSDKIVSSISNTPYIFLFYTSNFIVTLLTFTLHLNSLPVFYAKRASPRYQTILQFMWIFLNALLILVWEDQDSDPPEELVWLNESYIRVIYLNR